MSLAEIGLVGSFLYYRTKSIPLHNISLKSPSIKQTNVDDENWSFRKFLTLKNQIYNIIWSLFIKKDSTADLPG